NLEAYARLAWFIKTSGCYSILRMKAAGPGSSLELLKISFPIEDYKKHKLDEYFKGIKSRSSNTKIDYLELFLGELRKRGIKTRRRKEGPY
ncbi:hypothetical protein OA011_00110, partial [bacterium]|nr:hypothetical protein [bacterium]